MKVRQLIGATMIAGVATLGVGGTAVAQTQPSSGSSTSAQNAATRCQRAEARLPKLNDRKTRLEARIDKLKTLIPQAQDNHRDDLVAKLQAQLDKAQAAHDRVVDVINKIHERCGT